MELDVYWNVDIVVKDTVVTARQDIACMAVRKAGKAPDANFTLWIVSK